MASYPFPGRPSDCPSGCPLRSTVTRFVGLAGATLCSQPRGRPRSTVQAKAATNLCLLVSSAREHSTLGVISSLVPPCFGRHVRNLAPRDCKLYAALLISLDPGPCRAASQHVFLLDVSCTRPAASCEPWRLANHSPAEDPEGHARFPQKHIDWVHG